MQSTPAETLLTPDDVAERLGLHVRTVRRHIREGRLPAVRIGRRFRIHPEALDALIGAPPAAREPRGARLHVQVSSIVDVDDVSRETADHLTGTLLAAVKGRDPSDRPLRVDTIYDSERARLKVIVSGSVASTTVLLAMIGEFAVRSRHDGR